MFAKSKNQEMFPQNKKEHQMETRKSEKYFVRHANTEEISHKLHAKPTS